MLYPFKFKTIYKDKIWGGDKIKNILKKDIGDLLNCGETWEVSGVKGNISIVNNGTQKGTLITELIESEGAALMGRSVIQKFGKDFPLLIKFIDANADLSIQVHPNDALAKIRHDSFGKTEMWYVMQADEDSSLISGFNQPLTKKDYLEAFEEGKLDDVLNRETVARDDVYFLPAGRVHTIGEGLLIAEIQQSSDVTYRIYDFDRTDAEGNKRELHVEQALDAIDFTYHEEYKTIYDKNAKGNVPLVQCEYFLTNKINIDDEFTRALHNIDSFVIYIVLEGEGVMVYPGGEVPYVIGDCILVPALFDEITLKPSSATKMLETYIPEGL